MDNFEMKKSKDSNIYKSIRFPIDLDNTITSLVLKANEGLEKRQYSFNGFVISACQFALANMKDIEKDSEEDIEENNCDL